MPYSVMLYDVLKMAAHWRLRKERISPYIKKIVQTRGGI